MFHNFMKHLESLDILSPSCSRYFTDCRKISRSYPQLQVQVQVQVLPPGVRTTVLAEVQVTPSFSENFNIFFPPFLLHVNSEF